MLRPTAMLALAALPFTFAQISDDFESGWDETTWPTYAVDCDQGGNVTLDTSVAHSGSNSVRVDGAGGYCGHKFFGTTNLPTGDDIFVRAWIRASTALTDSHVTFITMPDPAQGDNKHLRIGGQSKILMYNRESDDATLPDLSPDGIAASVSLTANQWTCFEYRLGTSDGSISTWVDGTAVAGLAVGGDANNAYAEGWSRSSVIPKIEGVYFGWESYSGDENTFWYDDIAVAGERVGCDV